MTPLKSKRRTSHNPSDAKLTIKIINRLNKIAKHHSIKKRRTYVKELKDCRLSICHFCHVKKRS